MAKKSDKATAPMKRITPPQEMVTDAEARDALNTKESSIVNDRVQVIANLLWHHENATEEQINVRIVRAIEFYNSLTPVDGAESMLAQQMVGTHFAAMDCLRRAALPNQTFAGRDMALKNAQKLMALYAKQFEALNKTRGKGQQKVTVEHVHVAAGGQAIVGNIETGARLAQPQATPQIENAPDLPLDLRPEPKKAKASRGRP